MNALQEKYAKEIKTVLGKYPDDQKRAAVMPLLYIAQREQGYVSKHDMQDIAELCEISSTDVASIIGFYTLYHEKPEGKIRIQVCNDLPCALRGADDFLESLCEALGIGVGETTPDGMVTIEAVMCLAACDRAPMFQAQTGEGIHYHEHQTVETALKVIAEYRAQEETK
ncbi:MAG: NAD(P)H-dependent oxidoreductase subunit E [Anaerolineales bacterium]|nr:NAD(P)H-dependent oxidoreductase subunit E [Anaerolineales bacterium]